MIASYILIKKQQIYVICILQFRKVFNVTISAYTNLILNHSILILIIYSHDTVFYDLLVVEYSIANGIKAPKNYKNVNFKFMFYILDFKFCRK